jgi:hypothetical protein
VPGAGDGDLRGCQPEQDADDRGHGVEQDSPRCVHAMNIGPRRAWAGAVLRAVARGPCGPFSAPTQIWVSGHSR